MDAWKVENVFSNISSSITSLHNFNSHNFNLEEILNIVELYSLTNLKFYKRKQVRSYGVIEF